ncbi:MAG: M20/M25/M40 family metallo-hydrolase, partial [Chloroflexi bacterium]|nr:M20/M25/M40 family metallo-hydrolase [Chloroflexota bacterium]
MPDWTALLSSTFPDYVRDLETLVNIDCGTNNKTGVDRVVRLLRDRLSDFGAKVIDYPQTKYGDCVYGRWRGKGQARILLIGHTDTVYSDGTASQFPFRRKGSRAMGAGVNDMKAGLLNGLYTLHALTRSGFDDFAEVGLFCNSDEEIGSPISRPLYGPLAQGAQAALILEPARENGAIVSARKGVATFDVLFHGKSAHAGVEPEKGANAVLALARCVERMQALNGFRPGLTVNVGVVRGGTRSNVVAESAEAEVDVRIARAEDEAPFTEALRKAVLSEMVPGVTAELKGGLHNPPMEKTQASARLV